MVNISRVSAILLAGVLSILCAEVFSGASQMWFIDPWGILITYPLYLSHLLFFISLAIKYRRVSLSHLYLFGMVFGLYESWVTKVLWSGYMNSSGASMGTVGGIAIGEFSILVFFWHPVMSFIAPILIFEIITGKHFKSHRYVLKKTPMRTILLILYLILLGSFVAMGNRYNPLSAFGSLIGTILIAYILSLNIRGEDIRSLELSGRHFYILIIYIVFLYVFTFMFLLPQRAPSDIISYLSIISVYAILSALIYISKPVDITIEKNDEKLYSIKNLITFATIILISSFMFSLLQYIGYILLILTYLSLMFGAPILFIYMLWRILRTYILS